MTKRLLCSLATVPYLTNEVFVFVVFLNHYGGRKKKSRQISILHSTFDYYTSAVSWLFRLSFKNCKFDNMHSALYIIFENIVDNRR